MKQIRYTASVQLGLWDSLPEPETFRSQLRGLLAANSHEVVEYGDLNPVEDSVYHVQSVPTSYMLQPSTTVCPARNRRLSLSMQRSS